MVYLKSVENAITLGKLIGLLFLFCLPLLSILFFKTKRNDLARPVMGTIFLVSSKSHRRRNSSLAPVIAAKSCRLCQRMKKSYLQLRWTFSFHSWWIRSSGKYALAPTGRIALQRIE